MIDTILHDRYQIRDLLTQKAGRSTFIALDLQSQNLVIIKIVRFSADFQWDNLKLFEREATTLRNLDHPAIPQYLDYFEIADGFVLVQTYIDAPSLAALIESGRKFSEAEVVELANKLLTILAYLHEQLPPVIHRDLKPSNILLTNRSGNSIGDVYLVDFGSIQTAASTDGGTITIVGSYGYTPPEQFYGQTTIASDLYSLGMTLIYLVTGNHPAELASVNGRIQFDRSNLSGKLTRWLEKMTEYNLDRRFNSTQIAKTALISSDVSYGDFQQLRPANSQVEIYRDLDRLELKLGHQYTETIESDRSFPFLVDFIKILNICGFVCCIFLLLAQYVLTALCLLSFVALVHTLNRLVIQSIESTRHIGCTVISFDRVSKRLIFGVYSQKAEITRWFNQPEDKIRIDLLIYQPSYSFTNYFDVESNQTKSGVVDTTSKLLICRGKHQYFIAENQLSEAELHWIGQELSDFLDLELQIMYPTPNIPAPVAIVDNDCGCF
jgi:serine/threonine protein kinase